MAGKDSVVGKIRHVRNIHHFSQTHLSRIIRQLKKCSSNPTQLSQRRRLPLKNLQLRKQRNRRRRRPPQRRKPQLRKRRRRLLRRRLQQKQKSRRSPRRKRRRSDLPRKLNVHQLRKLRSDLIILFASKRLFL